MAHPFLTARWCNIFLANYAVASELLEKHLPPGLELDTRDGQAFVSLVAFDFLDMRVLGVPWLGLRNIAVALTGTTSERALSGRRNPGVWGFPEINLRFYVRQGKERGVVFLRELVPDRVVAWAARWLYNEPYLVAPIGRSLRDEAGSSTAEYQFSWKGQKQFLSVTGSKPAVGATEEEDYFVNLRWGFGANRRGRALRYDVRHSPWKVYPMQAHRLDFDFGLVYGEEWKFLNNQAPHSLLFADGSEVAVYRATPQNQVGNASTKRR